VDAIVKLPAAVRARFEDRVGDWRIVVEQILETESSVIGFGTRGQQSVVLKVIRQSGDEWDSGKVLDAFNGVGVVRVYEYVAGAMLLERLTPGNSLVSLSLNGKDEEATNILADVIHRMSSQTSGEILESKQFKGCATVQEWAKGFDRYMATGDAQIPKPLLEEGRQWYSDLAASQRQPRLLHGDLQHYNVLFDSERGWLAIDPKGVIGEIEYEIGAILRNPIERPDIFLSTACIERRLTCLVRKLDLDFNRAMGWGFAQAVLSAVWKVEDGFRIDERSDPAIRLANAIRPMLC
jgi:streptomycin 6-kinase